MPEVELSGGEHDGKRFHVPEPLPHSLYMPVPVRIIFAQLPEGEMPPMPPEPLCYQRAGIRDDGTDWYQLRS